KIGFTIFGAFHRCSGLNPSSIEFGGNESGNHPGKRARGGGTMDGIRNVKRLFVIAVVAGFSVCCLFAQTFGEVTGRVTDPSGAVIPGASLTLTNVNTSGVRNVVTTEPGTYTFPSIPPGVYRLRTELPGFKTAVSEPFEVQVQQVVRLDVVLQLGQVSDTVEV